MSLLSREQIEQLRINGQKDIQHWQQTPVVKLTIQGNAFTWLLYAVDPQDSNTGYGLFVEFDGFARYGSVDLQDLFSFKSELGTSVGVDMAFNAKFSIEVYKAAQWWHGYLIEDEKELANFVREPLKNGQLSLF